MSGRGKHSMSAWIAIGALAACGAPDRGTDAAVHEPASGAEARAGDPGPLPAESLYQLAGEWEDQGGSRVGLDVFRGHPVAIALFFGSCRSACPVTVHDLQQIDDSLPARERAALRVLLVSLDPEADTPERLAEYAREKQLPLDRWRLLRGDPDSLRELAAVLGVRYRKTGDGQIQHSARITLLDPQGVIARQLDDPAPAAEPLIPLIAGWVSG